MSKQTYYCWMRVLPADASSSAYETQGASNDETPSDEVYRVLYGGRPPTVRSVDRTSEPDADSWFADEENCGNPKSDLVFDYGPAYRNRKVALTWLLTRQGKKWAAEAANFLLLTFERELE